MGGRIENVKRQQGVSKPQTVLEAEKKDKIPRGAMYLAEQIANALKGKGTKDPAKMAANALNNWSESPSYKTGKKIIKKGIISTCKMILYGTKILLPEELVPYYTGEATNMSRPIYM